MIGMGGWDIIKRHDSWIDYQGVNMGGPSKKGHYLQLVGARGVVKNRLDGKLYLLIFRKYIFNKNLDKTLLAEYQIKCYGLKVN